MYKKNLNFLLKDIEILMSFSMRINFEGYFLGKVNYLVVVCILSKKKRKNIEFILWRWNDSIKKDVCC